MSKEITRREFMSHSSSVVGGGMLGGMISKRKSPVSKAYKSPHDYIIVEGHRDIWEFNDRFDLGQNSPLNDYMLPRILDGGLDVVIMPVGGDAPNQRAFMDRKLEGSMQVTDMLIRECEKTNDRASILRSKADIPTRPDKNKVLFFMDIEGGSPIQVDPETYIHSDRRLALLRNFYRLGVRGLQLTHNGRNQLADGVWEGKMAGKISKFGVEVVQEMNRIGMMIGVSHLSASGIFHLAEITTKPIVSTHTNIQAFINTPRQHNDEEIKAIASTGGLIGIRYISERTTPYELLVDEIDYMVNLVGIKHVAVGWLGHDKGHPKTGMVPGYTKEPPPTGIEAQTMYEHWNNFIGILNDHGYTDEQISLILGGNFIRIWNEILTE